MAAHAGGPASRAPAGMTKSDGVVRASALPPRIISVSQAPTRPIASAESEPNRLIGRLAGHHSGALTVIAVANEQRHEQRLSWAEPALDPRTILTALMVRDTLAKHSGLVLPLRIELRTSSLPMKCSTTELRQRAGDRSRCPDDEAAKAGDHCHRAETGASAPVARLGFRPPAP